jgi:hypothetical protein
MEQLLFNTPVFNYFLESGVKKDEQDFTKFGQHNTKHERYSSL